MRAGPSHFGVISIYGAGQEAGQLRVERREESPGSTKQGWRVTPAEGNLRESATESIPPMEAKPHRQG